VTKLDYKMQKNERESSHK